MSLSKRYNPSTREPEILAAWEQSGTYHFEHGANRPVFSIDTPPPTVSGRLHLGHVYSYAQTDFAARYRRMRGENVFYPMGFDDNGLPTERLVERLEGIRAAEMERETFIQLCLTVSEQAEEEYRALWKRLGLSIDWRHTYRTIDEQSRRLAQWSFLDFYAKKLVYRKRAPAIWCPECQTSIAQAEVNDLERETTFHTLRFELENGTSLPIATTRPELLPACVAIFLHPEDPRAKALAGKQAKVPYFGQRVPILTDTAADPSKGTGIVMCCTFGDTTDVTWWHKHELPLIEAIGPDGTMLAAAGMLEGMSVSQARQAILEKLDAGGWLVESKPSEQSVRVHERCDTPIEFLLAPQWFVRVLDFKQQLIEAGERIDWYPAYMGTRYRQWVENLAWDWCISRQRYFGVPFPLWYCKACGEILLAEESQLPVDPMAEAPSTPCPACGGTRFEAETDVMDTWATSSLTPQIVGGFMQDPQLYQQTFPFMMRPQAHEIIRTWLFYTIVKSLHHFGDLPWRNAVISGWALAPEGMGKISKSRGGGPVDPLEMIERYSADAIRYWAASTGLGKDTFIDERRIQAGEKLVNKLWNVARFVGRFLEAYQPPTSGTLLPPLTLADRWILARAEEVKTRTTALWEQFDYATAKSELEQFFWHDLADNYLEMAKQRLYAGGSAGSGARFSLYHVLLTTLKLFAPILPYVTEAIYQGLFDAEGSIHLSTWPGADTKFAAKAPLLEHGELLIAIATTVRRYKSENALSLNAALSRLEIVGASPELQATLTEAEADLLSITRAERLCFAEHGSAESDRIKVDDNLEISIARSKAPTAESAD